MPVKFKSDVIIILNYQSRCFDTLLDLLIRCRGLEQDSGIFSALAMETGMQWNLYNEPGKVLLKAHKFHHFSGMVFIKSCLFSLS